MQILMSNKIKLYYGNIIDYYVNKLTIFLIMNLPKFKNIIISQYQPGKSFIGQKKKIFKLSANESALGPSPKAIKTYQNVKNLLFRYPDSNSLKLRKNIAKKNKINSEQIMCGNGSDEIIQLICQLFIKPKDEVIIPEYSFAMYKIYSKLCGAKIIFAKEKNFKVSTKEILKKITKKTKIVFIANPNNPTGTFLEKKDLLELRNKIRKNILLVIDDAYCEYIVDKNYKSGLDLFKNKKNVIITRTFSKIYGLAALRVGWGYGSKKIIDAMYKIKPPFNVNRAALEAASEAINDSKWIKKSIKYNIFWSRLIYKNLKKLNIELNYPSANFFLLRFNNTKKKAIFVNKELIKKGFILRQMNTYNIKNALRFTIGNKLENNKFLNVIKKIL